MQSPLILLAHGSRNPDWLQSLEMGCEIFQNHGDRPAQLAYMELAQPTLIEVIEKHYLNGNKQLQVLPLFFAPGKHLQEDIPKQIEQLQAKLPGLTVTLLPALGEKASFWRFLADLTKED